TPSAPAAGGPSASQTPSDEASQAPGRTPEKTPGTEKPGAASPDPSAPEQSSPPAGSSSKPSRGAPPPVIPARPSAPPVTTPAKPTPETPGQSGKPSKPTQPGKNATVEAQILALVNAERAKAGCQPVKADRKLDELAADFSRDMAVRGFFSHTSPDGESPWDRADAAGVTNLGGENIARGQADAEAVMEAWMQSPGHRANILNCDYKTMGVGAHFEPGGPWWTQNFGF
ncbi:CAP domain-containing protein, partial [Streptomyces sparsus]